MLGRTGLVVACSKFKDEFFLNLDQRIPDYSCTLNQQYAVDHKVDRVLGFSSSRPNWDPPPPQPAGEFGSPPPPPWVPGGGTHLLGGQGLGGPNTDEGTDTLVKNVHIYCTCTLCSSLMEQGWISKFPWL